VRFAIISPASGLQEFATLSKTHLLLAHVKNPVYWKFYQQLAQDPSEMLILDNSAYEGEQDMDTAIKQIEFLGRVDALVMPDIFRGEARANFDQAVEFIRKWRHQLPCELMYCPQFNLTYDDHLEMIKYTDAMWDYFDIRWFGIPRLIAEQGYSRAAFVSRIKSGGHDGPPYVHALGMCAGNLKEMNELREAGCDSIDSSAPVWRGWNGYDIERYKEWNKNGTACDFNARPEGLTQSVRKIILSNLRKVGVAC